MSVSIISHSFLRPHAWSHAAVFGNISNYEGTFTQIFNETFDQFIRHFGYRNLGPTTSQIILAAFLGTQSFYLIMSNFRHRTHLLLDGNFLFWVTNKLHKSLGFFFGISGQHFGIWSEYIQIFPLKPNISKAGRDIKALQYCIELWVEFGRFIR